METKNKFYWLDGLRFIAALMVLIGHSRNDFFMAYGYLPAEQHGIGAFLFYTFGRLGHEAVVAFFVLSGFLVGGRGFERIRNGSFDVRTYAIDRFARITPPLLLAIVFYFVTCQFVTTEVWSWKVAAGNLLNLQGIACRSLVRPFWSLSYEWWFYIVFGCMALTLMAKKPTMKIVGLVLVCGSVSVFLVGHMQLYYLLIWMVGALAYIARPQKANKKVLWLSIAGILVCSCLYEISKDTHSMSLSIEITNQPVIEIMLSLSICLLIQQLILHEPRTKRGIRFERAIGAMGNFSYSLYLSHRIVMMWLFYYVFTKHGGYVSVGSFFGWIGVMLVCLFVCWLLSLLSEKHTPYVKKQLKIILLKDKSKI